MKTCPKCRKELPNKSFSKRKRGKDGYNPQCKSCVEAKRQALIVYKRGTPIERDRYGLSKLQIKGLSEDNQWTLRSVKEGYYSEYFWDKSSYSLDDVEVYKTLMAAIKGIHARGKYKKSCTKA